MCVCFRYIVMKKLNIYDILSHKHHLLFKMTNLNTLFRWEMLGTRTGFSNKEKSERGRPALAIKTNAFFPGTRISRRSLESPADMNLSSNFISLNPCIISIPCLAAPFLNPNKIVHIALKFKLGKKSYPVLFSQASRPAQLYSVIV